jgi:uncharacterized protein YwgA
MESAIRNRASLVLALLYAGDAAEAGQQRSAPVEGITRLEKLLFLLNVEKKLLATVPEGEQFHFVPFRMGPWTQEVYDEVDFLESLGLLTKSDRSDRSPADDVHDEELFDSAVIGKWQRASAISAAGSETFQLTEAGRVRAAQLWRSLSEDERKAIAEVKRKFNRMNLRQFLRYVYKQHPQFATESEIRDYLGV